MKFVEAMPEDYFGFKPTDEMKTYQSQLIHITTWLRTHSRFVTESEFTKVKLNSKETIKDALEEFFNGFLNHLEKMDDTQLDEIVDVWYGKTAKYQIANVMDNHLSHHRGQMVVYLRAKGQKPPSYTGW